VNIYRDSLGKGSRGKNPCEFAGDFRRNASGEHFGGIFFKL
jgi:hypothetical protein